MKKVTKGAKKSNNKKTCKILNRKGFTLIELLAVIAVLSLVLSVTIYSVTTLIRNAKEKTYATTINEMEKAAGNYSLEKNDELFFVENSDHSAEYQCITVKNLIDSGFLDNTVVKSRVTDDRMVSVDDYIYLERNIDNKVITKMSYTPTDEDASLICKYSVKNDGYILFSFVPDGWSRVKNGTITYKIKNNGKVADSRNYNYSYTSWNAKNEKDERFSGNSENGNMVTLTGITEYHSFMASITGEGLNGVNNYATVSQFDDIRPKIVLADPVPDTPKIVDATATVAIRIYDVNKEGNKCVPNDCSGISDDIDNNYIKNNIIGDNKLKVYIGTKEINNIKLERVGKTDKYNLTVTASANGELKIEFLDEAIYDNTKEKNYNERTLLKPNIIFDDSELDIDVSNGETIFTPEQKPTLTCSDKYDGFAYYIGPENPTTNNVAFISVANGKYEAERFRISIKKSISEAGKYYFACKNSRDKIKIIEKDYLSYCVVGKLNSNSSKEGEYSNANYTNKIEKCFLGIKGMKLDFTDILSNGTVAREYIVSGSSLDEYKGCSIKKPNDNDNTIASVSYNPVILSENNSTYYLWFNKNRVNIIYNVNGGQLDSDSNDKSYVQNDDGDIITNKTSYLQVIRFGETLGTKGLYNWNYKTRFSISKEGSVAVDGSEYICLQGCDKTNKTFNHDTQYSASDFCNIDNRSCNVKLGVNWTEFTYGVHFDCKYGTCTTADKSNIKYSATVSVTNPWKKIKFNPVANSSSSLTNCENPTIGSAKEYSLKFDGWYKDDKLFGGTKTSNGIKFTGSEIEATKNAKIDLTAKWSINPDTNLSLPTVSRQGCICGWDTTKGTSKWIALSGETYPNEINPNGSATDGNIVVNLYPVCMKTGIDENRCYYNSKDKNDPNNHNEYFITTCEGGNNEKCNYTMKNGVAASGQVLRANLKGEGYAECKYKITYDCKTNGGSSNNSTAEYTYVTDPDLSKQCSKSGWEFVGWNTNKNATSKIAASSIIKKNQTIYAIYKKNITTTYYGENYGISKPTNIDTNSYPGTNFSCTNNNLCTSVCTIYNNQNKCIAITPEISKSGKSFFSGNKYDYGEYDKTKHLWEHSTFGSTSSKNYYVPHDSINDIRYRCIEHDDGKFRLDIYNIIQCDGKTCTYNKHNGLDRSNSVGRSNLMLEMGYNCKAEYYASVSEKCYNGVSTGSGKKADTSKCVKLSLYRSEKMSGSSNNWYYVPDKKCYISGANLSTSFPSSCNSGSSSTSSGSGRYCVTIASNGGTLTSTGSYGSATVCYSSVQYLHPYLDNTFYRQGCHPAGAGGYTTLLDASDNGKYLYVNWACGGNNGVCYSCTSANGLSHWYTYTPTSSCASRAKASVSNCNK